MASAPSSINRYFFQNTNDLHAEIVALHDFVLPTATALWNFRNVIGQEFKEDPLVPASKLAIKYNTAPGTRESTNLVVPFRSHSWDMQRERLAEVALINVIALFEMWCDEVCDIFRRSDLAIKLQHPTNSTGTGGVRFALREMQSARSMIIANSVQSVLRNARKYSYASLDNLMKCFRYFKEVRNCLMHRGRKCEGKLWGAQSEFIPVSTQSALGMDFVPEHQIANQGDEIHVSLHGVLGFTEVILRIVTTIDADLAATEEGEQVIIARIADSIQIPTKLSKLPNLFTTMGWPGAILTPELLGLLRTSGVVS